MKLKKVETGYKDIIAFKNSQGQESYIKIYLNRAKKVHSLLLNSVVLLPAEIDGLIEILKETKKRCGVR